MHPSGQTPPVLQDRIDNSLPITFPFGNLTKIDPAVKEKWLTALRSGDYSQIQGALKALHISPADPDNHDETRPPGYCCLGVLCDIAVKESVITDAEREAEATWVDDESEEEDGHYEAIEGHYLHYWTFLGSEEMPPPSVNEWAGISEAVSYFLASKNDEGATFADIADFIEREL